jgi:hypothetical protein
MAYTSIVDAAQGSIVDASQGSMPPKRPMIGVEFGNFFGRFHG